MAPVDPRADHIPVEVWAAIDRAAALAGDLAARGERVAFESHHLTGRVVGSLVDDDGTLVRRLRLDDLIDLDLAFENDPAPTT